MRVKVFVQERLGYQRRVEPRVVLHNDFDSEIAAYTIVAIKTDCKKKMTLKKMAGKRLLS